MLFKRNKSFTLLEIAVVIIIVGILAGFAIPNYRKSILKSNERNAITNLIAIRAALKLYLANTGLTQIPANWNDSDTVNAELGLSIFNTQNLLIRCRQSGGGGAGAINRCFVRFPDLTRIHFHYNGLHHPDGSIHCTSDNCPSCPRDPGSCG